MTNSKINHMKVVLRKKSREEKKLPEIHSLQVLRAIAAISISAAHIDRSTELLMNRNISFMLPRFFDWGIDLFFVLSGFIIFYAYNKDFGKPYKLKEYLIKRFIRIYPLYWIATLLVLPIFFIFKNIGSGYERDLGVIIKSFFLIPQTHSPVLFVGWTLVHEIRFYLIFGLLIWLKKGWGIILICILILSTIFTYVINPSGYSNLNPQNLVGYLFSYFNIEFLLGVFGAYIMGLSNTRLQKFYLIILMFSYPAFLRFSNIDILEQRVFLLGIPFVIIVTLLGIYELKRFLKVPKILLYLGQASFSIYLTHVLINGILIRFLIIGGFSNSSYLLLIMLGVLLSSVVGGCIFYSKIEKPMLSYLKARMLD